MGGALLMKNLRDKNSWSFVNQTLSQSVFFFSFLANNLIIYNKSIIPKIILLMVQKILPTFQWIVSCTTPLWRSVM